MLYEGIQAQYSRLGLTESNPGEGNTRIWEGTYTPNIRRYLSGLVRGKKELPPVSSTTNQEAENVRKSAPQANTLNLFGNLSNRAVGQAEITAIGTGTVPSNDNGRDGESHSGSHEQSDGSGRNHAGTSSDASGKGNLERETTHSDQSQRTRIGQLTIFESSPSQKKEPTIVSIPEVKPKGTNFKFDPKEDEKRNSDRIKLQQITEAVKLLKQLESEDRSATPDEQKVLTKFSGFGGVANIAFRESGGEFRPGYEALATELEENLSKEELHSAKRSTPNAFYTARSVMHSMYDALSQMGVTGETIQALEPGSGIGNFMGLAPEAFKFVGVEKEGISARIARQLYPDHTIIHKDYKDTETILRDDNQPLLQDGAFDVVIGNIPFGKIQLPYQDGKSYKIHDYFFLKSLDKLREGGIMAVVTSSFTMDKRDDSVRKLMAEQADLVAAFRLPNQAFANQGTQVLTDILILKKRSPEKEKSTSDWFDTVSITVNKENALSPSEEGVHINEYFLAHPDHIIGDQLSIEKQMYARESLQVKLEDRTQLPERLKHLANGLPAEIYKARPPNTPAPLKQASKQLVSQEPSQEHIREGSFLLQGRKIQQVQSGEVVDVIQRNKPLTTDGKTGKRIRDYVQVRDAVKKVIQTQKEQLPEEQRDQARKELDRAYDRFVRIHGPINAVKLFESADKKRPGETKITRRFVNVNDLRGDPDIYLVMSIEKYDEKTNQAEKGDIFSKDIVSPKREILAENPEEGLIVSLQQLGRVDTAYIADICACKEEEIITSLQNRDTPLIYFDPEKEDYTTREDYLSGNIREKLKSLEKFEGEISLVSINEVALNTTLPEPIPYEQVTANLGASWIQPRYIRQFAEENFGGEWNIQFISKNAQWIAERHGYISMGQEGDSYGVGKLSGEKLFILTLEGKSAKLYKTVSDGAGGDKRVLDREQTLLARQSQEKIRQRFKQWVFEDTDRAEALAKTYNETFNSVVLRKYEGNFLSFEGMNSGIQLRSHQKDAVYRIMSEDSCLLAHATGAGKTFSMVTAGMSLKKMGLRHKPLYVVPNHMLEQFSREFLTLYPDADILVTTKKDLQKENRKLFTAKAATGDWDAIIMTHSSFNKVGMSPQYQESFIQKEIESYEELLDYAHTQSGSNRRFIKDIETAKQNLEHKLDTVVGQNARSKDQHIFFEELGVDHIFIDEAHAFKNLQIQTKMDRVAGLNTNGSARSLNLFMITEYLNEQDQTGTTFATATPITNSLSEMYTMMRYLIPDQMEEMGIQHFDAWAAAFGEVVTRLEIKPDASTIDFQSRFAKFHNVPELLQLFNLVTDVKRPEDLDLPVPEARYETIAAEPSEELLELQQGLQARYQKVRNGSVDPKDDNALKICTEGRKAALDVRLVNPFAFDNPGSKVNQLVDKVYYIWEQNADSKATQMIFSDIGVHGKGGSLSVYEDVIDKLSQRGIPREQLANINDYGTDVKKAALFEKMRRGEVRVLIGSTQKMGTGTNVQGGTLINGKMQGGLIALHHMDAPWRPADMEQRDGRIIRQGNPFKEIDIYRYITQQSFDAVMWQKLEQKQHFISQIMTNSLTERTIDDVGSEEALAFAEVAAIASGNPEILELAEVEAEIRSLSLQEEAYQQKITRARREQSAIPGKLYRYEQNKTGINQLIQERDQHLSRLPADKEGIDITIGYKHPENRKEANLLLKTQIGGMYAYQHTLSATVQGLSIYVERFGEENFRFQVSRNDLVSMNLSTNDIRNESTDLVRRLDNLVGGLEKKVEALDTKIGETHQSQKKVDTFLQEHETRVAASSYDSGFEDMKKLVQLRSEKERLEGLLATKEESEIKEELPDPEVSDAVILPSYVELERVV
ncbi:hypothetical protein AB832_07115 [Flavobacteriaceae bacterium (ex Bugula neritina AB1)]|nr:hypothetical protein AB832_07115 [Flavobacteriaceae bacterium (ex Bugula neritina AB1)]